ncbi:hypothetical protein LTR94_029682, partial [Friedmanniomyces endolithicus]
AGKEILPLGDKLRHRRTARRQPIILADKEPDRVDLILIELRGLGFRMALAVRQTDHEKWSFLELVPHMLFQLVRVGRHVTLLVSGLLQREQGR